MGHKKIEYNAFDDVPLGKRAVLSYSHYYHKWMVVNEEENEEWDTEMWEAVRYKNTFRKWAYVDVVLTKGKIEEL